MKNTLPLFILFILSVSCHQQDNNQQPETTSVLTDQELVLIPGGEFKMGQVPSKGQKYIDNYSHTVRVDSFYIDKYEVTNAQYFAFCEATGHPLPEFWEMGMFNSGPDYLNHPVTGITWSSAKAYAAWKGLRLPTEAEWEYAARGGLTDKRYPMGNDMDSTLANYHGTWGQTLEVGSFPSNGYGLYDMAGNVVEWVNDFYAKDYYLESEHENPAGPLYGKRRVIRGGGWRSGIGCSTVYFRQSLRPGWVDFNVGFRCAKDL
jgi:formylglycine-generating enzyme required for sulfatase activity